MTEFKGFLEKQLLTETIRKPIRLRRLVQKDLMQLE